MDWLTIIFLIYTFIAIYFLSLYLLIYSPHRKEFFSYPKPKRIYPISIVVPCYNEESTIKNTIEKLINLNYAGLKKIVVVDDCSTDNSYKIIKSCAKKYSIVKVVQTPSNTGNAAGAKNYGAKFVETELIGFIDADSYPSKNSLQKMVGFFDNPKTGAVTPVILVKNRNTLIEKLQAIEYKIIAFTRKLLNFVEAIYVTPGPLALYRKSIFDELGGFDEKNLTEDIEITWHLISKGYTVQMSLMPKVYTIAPKKFKAWFKQRIRWNFGGLQSIVKYKKNFLKGGMLGSFVLPFFVLSWGIGIFGLGILVYRIVRIVALRYLSTFYSVKAQTAILRLQDINLIPNLLVFFGITLLIFSSIFTFFALKKIKEEEFKKHGLLYILLYMFIYLLSYPVILTTSIYKYLRGKKEW